MSNLVEVFAKLCIVAPFSVAVIGLALVFMLYRVMQFAVIGYYISKKKSVKYVDGKIVVRG